MITASRWLAVPALLWLASSSLVSACGSDNSASSAPDAGGPKEDGSVEAGSSDASVEAGSAEASAEAGRSDAGVDGASSDGGKVNVQILAFNDFHGNLRPPSPSNSAVLAKPGDPAITDAGAPVATDAGTGDAGGINYVVHAGGAAYFAAHVNALRAQNHDTLLVSAGDLTGASPLVSSLYDDEPTIDVMNAIGLDYHAVGNHEFDHGVASLLRFQSGGCDFSLRTDAGFGSCEADPSFPGASFEYLAANVDVNVVGDAGPPDGSTPKTLFPPYAIKQVGGAKIALIGLTLSDTTPYSPSGIIGLSFANEVATTNALVGQLKQQNVDAIVVLVHQGGFQSGTYNDCVGLNGPITAIADNLDPAVDVIHSAHTHVAYNCVRGNRILTSAASYGRIISQINLSIDTTLHKVASETATNLVVTRDVTADPTVDALVQRYAQDVAPVAERQVGQIAANIVKDTGANGEAPLGDVIADGMLAYAAAHGHTADAAFVNIGGIRDSLFYPHYYSEPDGDITYEKAQAVQPFSDKVVVMQCLGSDIIAATQQNVFVQASGGTKVLQVSNGFSYSWATSAASATGTGAADPASFRIGGAAINPTQTYNVVTVDFLQTGGDGYAAFKNCTNAVTLGLDLDALASYLGANESPPLAPPPANRLTKTN
jgi:5'-nucleotidase